MKVIAWLWNPWNEYHQTRHNVGYLFVEYLRDFWKFENFKDSKFKAVISEWNINWEKIVLIKPMTYMNLSWESLKSIWDFYKIDFENDIIVIYDDISMDFGKIRFRNSWSSWWHNGIKSITWIFGTEKFKRIKIGVWIDTKYEVSDWVLSKFNKNELENLHQNIFSETLKLLETKIIN